MTYRKTERNSLTCGDAGGRYWDRTSDLFRVREARYRCANRPFVVFLEVETGFEPVYTALQAVASPLGHSTVTVHVFAESGGLSAKARSLRADNRARTGDLNLGKVALYQLSYVRGNAQQPEYRRCACLQTLSDCRDGSPTGHPTSVIVSLRSHQNAEKPATPDSGRGPGWRIASRR